ncbi:MAG: zf-TFIIB domain-containing protein [Candidatus Solibacter sp.]
MKATLREHEYFARQEAELSRQGLEAREAKLAEEQRERDRSLHFMKYPKCGMQLEEITAGDVHLDKCSGCQGIWLDRGELEVIKQEESGFLGRLSIAFR